MLPIEEQLDAIREWSGAAQDDVLTVYADIDPAKPENARGAWVTRVKNSLHALPEVRNQHGKRDQPLYDRVLDLLESDRPDARTLVLVAHREPHGKLHAERLDLQVELPVVDLAHGQVEARYGAPHLAPLWFAVDEYERAGIVVLEAAGRWRFLEAFLGDIREADDVFASISDVEWRRLREASRKISDTLGARAAAPGGRYDKLSPRDRTAARVDAWTHKLYTTLARLLDQTSERLAVDRLVVVGEHWQVRHFQTYLSRGLERRLCATLPLLPEARREPAAALWRRVEAVLVELERTAEVELLERILEAPGLWGVDPVLDALQLGRVQHWVVPWALEARIWRCPREGFVAATEETARILCEHPEEVALRAHVLDLSARFGARLELVRGEAERRLLDELGGMAALLRW